MLKLVKILLVAFVLAMFSVVAHAHNKVVVIPLGGAENPKNLIIVAKQNGDFDNPVDAIKSIKDAGSGMQRYTILIMPGVYTLTERLNMMPYVDIIGSGREPTQLKGALCGSGKDENSALVVGADDSSIRSLHITNTCANNEIYCFGFASIDTSPKVNDVTVECLGNARDASGVYLDNSDASMTYFDATATARALGAAQGLWIDDTALGVPEISHFTATAVSTSADLWGMYCGGDGAPSLVVEHALIQGDDYGSFNCNSDFRFSSLVGYYEHEPTDNPTCFATDDGAGNLLDSSCN